MFPMVSNTGRPLLNHVIQPPVSCHLPLTTPKLGRRALVSTAGIGIATIGMAVAGIGAAAAATVLASSSTGGSSGETAANPPRPQGDPQALVRSGMRKFSDQADVEGSIADFNAALAARPSMRPYLWQRGLSLYYVGTKEAFEEGAKQFRDDVAVNPNDTEESIWAFLCEAQLFGAEKAREQFLQVGRDSRPVMRAAYEAFKTGGDPSSMAAAANGDTKGHAAFYSNLYIGLWYEAEGDVDAAKRAMIKAVETEYAKGSGDYMAALARVHVLKRGWAM